MDDHDRFVLEGGDARGNARQVQGFAPADLDQQHVAPVSNVSTVPLATRVHSDAPKPAG